MYEPRSADDVVYNMSAFLFHMFHNEIESMHNNKRGTDAINIPLNVQNINVFQFHVSIFVCF